MKIAPYGYILKTVQQHNILPVTSACSTGCIFCSHRNNPDNIEAFNLPKLSCSEVFDMAEFLNGEEKIVIGESASRIIEGEPFIRKDMLEILKHLRNKYASAEIEITTGGTYLTPGLIDEIKKLGRIELNISLNSCTDSGRRLLFKGADFINAGSPRAVDAVRYLKDSGIPFNGSIVAMPEIVGYDDIRETISFLCLNGARTVRVFVPGFSRLSKYRPDYFEIRHALEEISGELYAVHNVPVLVEPPEIRNLDAEICGVIKDSIAYESGLKRGDVIVKVNDYVPFTRADAYERIYKEANPLITYNRDGIEGIAVMRKKAGTSPGAVFYYDIRPDSLTEIDNTVKKHKSKKPLVITSELGYPIVKLGLEKFLIKDIELLKVKNRWFGGSIMCAGLLTVHDIIYEISEQNEKWDLIIVPSISFDIYGKDLSGHGFYEIEEKLGIKVCAV